MMLRVCALENACAISSGLNTLGLKTDGEKTEGVKTLGLRRPRVRTRTG